MSILGRIGQFFKGDVKEKEFKRCTCGLRLYPVSSQLMGGVAEILRISYRCGICASCLWKEAEVARQKAKKVQNEYNKRLIHKHCKGCGASILLKSKEIKKILMRKNKSQNWFAQSLGISSCYISQLLDGSRNPSPKLREKIMVHLPGYKFDKLFLIKEVKGGKHSY